MLPSIKSDGGRWTVFRNGDKMFSGGYRQVEDWLDWAENCAKEARGRTSLSTVSASRLLRWAGKPEPGLMAAGSVSRKRAETLTTAADGCVNGTSSCLVN